MSHPAISAEPLLPDPGEIFRAWALTREPITAIVGDRVAEELRGDQPAIRYALVTGSDGMPEEDNPQLQVECWGRGAGAPDDGTASLLVRTVRAQVPTLRRFTHGSGYVANAYVSITPFDSSGPDTNRPRKILQIRLLTYPLEG